MKKRYSAAITVGILITLCAFGAEVKLLPVDPNLEVTRENGFIRLKKAQEGIFVPQGGFNVWTQYDFFFFNKPHLKISMNTGNGKESIGLLCQNNSLNLSCVSADNRNIRTWNDVMLNYISKAADFASMDNVGRWIDYYASISKVDTASVPMKYTISLTDSEMIFSANGIVLDKKNIAGLNLKNFSIQVPRNMAVGENVNVTELKKGFYMIDLTPQLNASGFDGKKLSALPKEKADIDGIPFLMANNDKYDNIDLSLSWVAAGMRSGYASTHPSERFPSPLKRTPARIHFNIPYDNYNALYVLAACEDRPDSIPRFTAQFFLPAAGHPKNFQSQDIPLFTAKSDGAVKIKTADGREGSLYLVRVKLEPGQLQEFSNRSVIGLELTKDTTAYRAYPDPYWYSNHGAGLPSAVHIFGATLGISPLKTDFNPDAYANIWKEGETVSYTADIENMTGVPKEIKLSITIKSYDGTECFTDSKNITVKPDEKTKVKFSFIPKKFGHYNVSLVKQDGAETETYERTLAYLRKRDYSPRSIRAEGMLYGIWDWSGDHQTPSGADIYSISGPAGLEVIHKELPKDSNSIAVMKQYGIKSYNDISDIRVMYRQKPEDGEKAAIEKITESFHKNRQLPSEMAEPVFTRIFAEPGGIGMHKTLPEFYGEDQFKLTPEEQNIFETRKFQLLASVKAARKLSPETKILMPHGDPMFTVPFLIDEQTRNSFDGVAVDFGYFDRLPEQQMHQCSLHRMMMFQHYWKKYRKDKPILVTYEGPCISPVLPGALTEEAFAAHTVRGGLILAGYGVDRQFTINAVSDCGDYWGEQHYGGGLVSKVNSLNPHVAYSAVATLTRHTRYALFDSYANTGSLSTYCANFRNTQDNKLIRILWAIRGKKEIELDIAPEKLQVYDSMDNHVALLNKNGKSILKIGQLPVYVYGTDEKTVVVVGESDNSDSMLGKYWKKLGNATELFTIQSNDSDSYYRESYPGIIERFHAKMQIEKNSVDSQYGGKALAVSLPKQEKDRGVMPFYTCLKLANPIKIDGKGSHLSLWVKAASDWGRIVYVLRDASGKQWVSVGRRNVWNADDTPGNSVFCFDGWRLLRFELPSNAPWDSFRELGTTWWGSENINDIVELPLSLEKIFIERREKVMYGNSLVAAPVEPVLLGDLYVEYEKSCDMGQQAVILSKLRVPVFKAENLPDTIEELKANGVLPAGKITSVTEPPTESNGTRAVFKFEAPADSGAVSYDIYVSRYPDGKGALKLGNMIKSSGALVNGFLADTDFYAFLVYKNKKGESSAPSASFKFNMKNTFSQQ